MPPPRGLDDDGAARAQVRSRDATLTLSHELLNPFHLFHLPAEPTSHLLHLTPEDVRADISGRPPRVRQMPMVEIQLLLVGFCTRTRLIPLFQSTVQCYSSTRVWSANSVRTVWTRQKEANTLSKAETLL